MYNLPNKKMRLGLVAKGEPYWMRLTKGGHLGYRRLASGGTWTVRHWDSDAGKHHYRALGQADDQESANGETILSCDQAQKRAREWLDFRVSGYSRSGVYTVGQCLSDYLTWLSIHRKSHSHVKTYVEAFIRPTLGNIDTAKLSSVVIRNWANQLAAQPPRLRTRNSEERKFRAEDPNPNEAARKRKLRANRQLSILKAALNRAWSDGLIARNDAWVRVKPFPNVEQARTSFLRVEEARRLLEACPSDLHGLVLLALLTGARYAELGRLKVGDFRKDNRTLFIRESKTGKSRYIALNDQGLDICSRLTKDRDADQFLLVKADGGPWLQDHQHRPFKAALKSANIDPKFTFHGLRHSWASLSIMNGAPLIAVATNLGHQGIRMVELHYGHLSENYVTDAIRRASPRF